MSSVTLFLQNVQEFWCREFAIGMGPKIFGMTKGETIYTIRLLPIGGYVRMAGEDLIMWNYKPGYRVGCYVRRG